FEDLFEQPPVLFVGVLALVAVGRGAALCATAVPNGVAEPGPPACGGHELEEVLGGDGPHRQMAEALPAGAAVADVGIGEVPGAAGAALAAPTSRHEAVRTSLPCPGGTAHREAARRVAVDQP